MASDADALAAGTMLGGYRIDYRIGGGGMGTVYAAEEPTIKKRVAIKVLRHALADDASTVARFEREARAANDVRHPAIVDVFAFGKLPDGRPYLVMSFLEGRSLAEEIARRGSIPPAEAWAWAREIAEALAAAHEAGIVHRDLKPDNVFLERFGGRPPRPRLLDLGLAKVTVDPDDEGPQPMKLTRSGVPMGTPAYMAPEQWWGADVDARADQYAFGVTLFEMLTGHPPFRSQQFMELAQQHMNAAPPRLSDAGCAVPQAVEALVARALSKSAGDRFPSMAELVAAGDTAFAADSTASSADVSHADTLAADTSTPILASANAARSAAAPTPALAEEAKAGDTTGVSEPSEATSAAWAGRLRRFVVAHAFVILGGPAALVALGYAGESHHDVRWWWKSGGPPLPFILIGYLAGATLLLWSARRRARTGTPSLVPWVIALLTGLSGALGTYVGWGKTSAGIAKLRAPQRFEILHMGIFELELSRFLGFYVAALLLVSIAASAGLYGSPRPSETLAQGLGVRRRESIAAAAGLVALAIAAIALGGPSGALVAGVAAIIVSLDIVLPALGRQTAARDELERTVAGLLAIGLVLAVAVTRVAARQAVLWEEQPTRAARAAEIVAAAHERTATLAIGLSSLTALVAIGILRLRRAWRHAPPSRPSGGALALAAIVAVACIGDITLHLRFASEGDRLHAELEPQFSLFARLEPPGSGDLDRKRHAPHPAPALQIARNVIAVNARPIAPLSAADSPDGSSNIGRDLSHALAEHAARGLEDPTDLSVSIDHRVPWSTALRLLSIARRSGARRVELLLTRGPALGLPADAPPEASWVLASDFVALRVELADEGFRAGAGETFGAVVPELIRRALAEDAPVKLSTAPR